MPSTTGILDIVLRSMSAIVLTNGLEMPPSQVDEPPALCLIARDALMTLMPSPIQSPSLSATCSRQDSRDAAPFQVDEPPVLCLIARITLVMTMLTLMRSPSLSVNVVDKIVETAPLFK